MFSFHPWRILRSRVGLRLVGSVLPNGLGRTDGRSRIEIDVRLGQAARRCALTHELVHIERGHSCAQPPKVELEIRTEAARRLLPLELLIHALSFSTSLDEVAFESWVTVDVLRDRLSSLTNYEQAVLAEQTAHHRDWA